MKKKVHMLVDFSNSLKFIFIIGLVFAFQNRVNAQVSAYLFSEELGSYSEITGGTVAYAAPWDNHTAGAAVLANIGFTFDYDSSLYTTCYISPNGFITFGATQPTATTYAPISIATGYEGAISAMGRDLISNTESITYRTIGAAPNRIFVVQWKDAERKTNTGVLNFQIRLYETSNEVRLHYGFCFPDDTTVTTIQVGLRGPSNAFLPNVNNRLQSGTNINNTWFTRSVKGTANTSSMRVSTAEYPENGLLYKFERPLPCAVPTGTPSGLVLGGTSVTVNSFVGNSFTPVASPTTQYLVLRSTVNTPPDASAIPNGTYWAVGNTIATDYTVISTTNSTTFIQTGLTNNTTYYYWVIPYNGICLGGPLYNLATMISGSQTTCIPAPTLAATTDNTGNGFTINFNPVAGATDYQVDISTNNIFTQILPAYSGALTGGSTSFVVTDLPPLANYWFRIRAVGLGCSINSTAGFVVLGCGYYFVPYSQNFDTTAANAIPACSATVDDNADGTSWRVQNINPASSPRALYLNRNTTVAMDDWFFLPGIKLDGGVSYRLFFRYNTTNTGGLVERLRVRLGSGQSPAQMNITILDLPSITNTIYQSAFVDFAPVSNGIYFLGFQGYSPANQSYLVLDDISVTIAPTCFEPENVSVSSVASNSVTIDFDPPTTVPANGYQYYLSTVETPPTGATVPSGSVSFGSTSIPLTGLTSSTSYYIWIRGNCGPGDTSVWSTLFSFSTECITPSFSTVTPANRCGTGTVNLIAIPNSGSVTEWYDAPSGGNLLFTGSTFTTPVLATTTNFYALAKAAGGNVSVGPRSPNAIPGAKTALTASSSVLISITENTELLGLDIFPLSSGQNGLIVIRNALNVAVASIPFTTSVVGGNTAQTIPINYDFIPGNYSVNLTTVPSSGLIGNAENVSYPYNSSVATINGNNFDNSFYNFFYNWRFTTTCISARSLVAATIATPPTLGLSSNAAIICSGESTSTITVTGAASFNTFTWSPATGISGDVATGFTFNPTDPTIYTLTASQTSGAFCTATATFSVTVNPSPPTITIVPGDTTICEGTIQPLSATFGASAAINIINENFEGPSGWTTQNNSIGGTVANANWTLRNSVYSYASAWWNFNASSNDASQFYMANSDAQGSPSSNITRTTLESPTFSLDGFSTAEINFWHYLRWITGNRAHVEVSIDNGVSWTLVGAYTGIQGSASNFVNRTINLTPYVGNSFVKIRFLFEATWDYGWAIDNVRVSGIVATAVVWTPIDDLYTDPLATIPYLAGTPLGIVYSMPTQTRTYEANVTTIDGCSTESEVTLTFIGLPIAGTLNGDQVLCSGSAIANLELVGSSGPVIRWEYADNAAFTVNLTTIASTNTVLTSLEMGVFSNIRYFRAVLQNGLCPIVYSNGVSVEFPTTIWNGTLWSNGLPDATKRVIFNGNYTSTGDIEACSIQVQSGIVTVLANHNFIVNNHIDVTGPPATTNFIFENNASLIQINNVVNTGPITYRRNSTPMVTYDYTYWSSPVANQTFGSFSPNTNAQRFYRWNTSIYNWSNVTMASTFVAGMGYIIRAPGIAPFNTTTPTIFNGQFVGIPHNGNITVPVVVNGLNDRNLLGNPYPSAISADDFMDDPANAGVVGGTIYFWTHNTPITNNQYTSNDYAIYNYTGGVGTQSATNPGINNNIPNGTIAAGQGFFMRCAGTGTATFRNSMRLLGSNTQFFRMSNEVLTANNENKSRLWLEISNEQGGFKQLMLGYVPGATNSFDFKYDGELSEAGNPVSFYTLNEDKKLTIQGRALPFAETDTHPIGFKAPSQGLHTIQLALYDGLFADQKVYLEDNLLNVIHDLKISSYEFFTEEGTFDNRFILRFTNETLSVNLFSVENVKVIKKETAIEVLASTSMVLDKVNLFDMRGRLIATNQNINANTTTFTNLNIASQILLVQIFDKDGNSVTKKLLY